MRSRLWIAIGLALLSSGFTETSEPLGPRHANSRSVPHGAFRFVSADPLDLRGPATVTLISEEALAAEPFGPPPEPFIQMDTYGLIVQADGDGGDTAQRVGMFYYVFDDEIAFAKSLDHLEIRPGLYVRHPYQPGFRSDPREFSRDQQRALVIAMGAYGMNDRLWRMTKSHLKRLGRYQNKDFVGPSHVGEYVRAFRTRPLYPVLLITDMALVINSIGIAITARWNPEDVDDNNHIMALAQAQSVMPTPASWLARKIYLLSRPANPGTRFLGEPDPAQAALSWYHRASSGGNPLIAHLYREILDSL